MDVLICGSGKIMAEIVIASLGKLIPGPRPFVRDDVWSGWYMGDVRPQKPAKNESSFAPQLRKSRLSVHMRITYQYMLDSVNAFV